MTTIDRPRATSAAERAGAYEVPAHAGRSEADILQDQIRGIESWNAARRSAEAALTAGGASREARLDGARRMDVLARVQHALLEHCSQHLRDSLRVGGSGVPRAMIVHRNEWFCTKVADALRGAGVEVVRVLDNGADGVGAAIAEQPDVVLLEDRLPMIGGLDVIGYLREHAPRTLTAAQVASEYDVGTFLDAGARTAYSRRVPPHDVAEELVLLLGQAANAVPRMLAPTGTAPHP